MATSTSIFVEISHDELVSIPKKTESVICQKNSFGKNSRQERHSTIWNCSNEVDAQTLIKASQTLLLGD
jgi:hypothetical protein